MEPSAATQQFADTLTKEGSLWFESAFCKGLRCGALLFSDPVEVILLYSLSDLERFFLTLEEKLAAQYFLAGWLSYEVGYGFEPTLFSVDPATVFSSPLAWFSACRFFSFRLHRFRPTRRRRWIPSSSRKRKMRMASLKGGQKKTRRLH